MRHNLIPGRDVMKKYCILSLLIFFSLFYSCDDRNTPDESIVVTLNILNENGDTITVAPPGIPVTLSFSFQNISNRSQTLHFTDGQQYDLEVYNSQGTLVWNWAHDMAFIASLTELAFDPGEVKTYEETWDQTSNEGIQVPAGIYDVYVNRAWNNDMSTGPIQIEIYENIAGTWNWYETSGGIGMITETPESTGETRRVVFDDNGNVTFYTNDEVIISSTYTLASEDTIISVNPLPVVIVEGFDSYIYSFPYEDELELQENMFDGFIHNYIKE